MSNHFPKARWGSLRATGFRESSVIKGRGICPSSDNVFMNCSINLICRNSGCHHFPSHVQHFSCHLVKNYQHNTRINEDNILYKPPSIIRFPLWFLLRWKFLRGKNFLFLARLNLTLAVNIARSVRYQFPHIQARGFLWVLYDAVWVLQDANCQ